MDRTINLMNFTLDIEANIDIYGDREDDGGFVSSTISAPAKHILDSTVLLPEQEPELEPVVKPEEPEPGHGGGFVSSATSAPVKHILDSTVLFAEPVIVLAEPEVRPEAAATVDTNESLPEEEDSFVDVGTNENQSLPVEQVSLLDIDTSDTQSIPVEKVSFLDTNSKKSLQVEHLSLVDDDQPTETEEELPVRKSDEFPVRKSDEFPVRKSDEAARDKFRMEFLVKELKRSESVISTLTQERNQLAEQLEQYQVRNEQQLEEMREYVEKYRLAKMEVRQERNKAESLSNQWRFYRNSRKHTERKTQKISHDIDSFLSSTHLTLPIMKDFILKIKRLLLEDNEDEEIEDFNEKE